MIFWSSRRGRTAAYVVGILIHGTIIAIGYYFVVSTLVSILAPSIARLVAAGFTIFLVIGGAFVWYRVIVLGELPWGPPRYAADLLEGAWKDMPPSPPPPAPPPGASEEEVIGYVRALRERYLMEEATAFIRHYLELHPQALRPRLLLASQLSRGIGEDPPEARRIYKEVLSEHPDNVAALCGLAMLHDSPGQIVSSSEAASLLARAADVSDDPEIIWTYAHVLLDTGNREGAKAVFERVLAHPRSGPPTTLRRRAKEMLKYIKRRRHPKYSGYWWPEM